MVLTLLCAFAVLGNNLVFLSPCFSQVALDICLHAICSCLAISSMHLLILMGDTVIPSSMIFVNGDAFTADENGDTVVLSNRIFASEDAIVDRNDQHADMIQEQRDASISVRVERSGEMQVVASGEDVTQQEQVQPTQIEVIELSDDDPDVKDQKYGQQFPDVNPEVAIWHYLDPYGIIQGPFPLTMLKHWSDIGCYFEPRFRVWMVGQSPQEAVVLVDLLRQFFPIQ